MLRRLLLVLLLLAAPVAADAREETRVQGVLKADTRWEGTIRLTGDVTVPQDVRLDIVPGTRVVISSQADPRGGWNDGLVEMHVHGQVVADGNLSAPIRFTPQVWVEKVPQGRPAVEHQPWLGIVFHPDAKRGSELRGCIFQGGLAAVQAGAPGLVLRDCVFHRCSVGVQAGALWASTRRPGPDLVSSAPRILRCRFGDCYVGVAVERAGRPEIERCLFFGCVVGAGNRREGITKSSSGLGPFVDRSAFLRCSVGLDGASRLMNSLFLGCSIALRASAFQRRYSDATDRVVRSHNLFHGNETIAEGDTPVGVSPILRDPELVQGVPALPSLPVLAADLKRVFQLRPTSPAIGAATDGGDLGPAGGIGARRPWDLEHEPGETLLVDRWLVAGPPAPDGLALDTRAAAKLAQRAPRPGRSVGGQTWAVLYETRDGAGEASPVLAEGGPVQRVAVALLRAERETDAVLVLGLDGRVQGWLGGEPLAVPSTRRRYDPDDLRARVRLRKGRNTLVLQLHPAGDERRFLCRLVASSDHRAAPPGVRVDTDAYASKRTGGGGLLAIEAARARREKGTSTWSVGLKLSAKVHWADIAKPRRLLALETESGRNVPLEDLTWEFKPATRFLWFRGVALRGDVGHTVRLVGARDPDGQDLEVEGGKVPLELR